MPTATTRTAAKPTATKAAPPTTKATTATKGSAPTKASAGPKPPADDDGDDESNIGAQMGAGVGLIDDGEGGFQVDWDNVEEATFEVMPKGTYPCVISEMEYKLSQASGQPMWALVLQVEEGEYANRKLFSNISFSPKALPFTKRTIARIAPELLTNDFNPKRLGDEEVLVGKSCRARVSVGKNTESGEPRNEVKELLPPLDTNAFMTAG